MCFPSVIVVERLGVVVVGGLVASVERSEVRICVSLSVAVGGTTVVRAVSAVPVVDEVDITEVAVVVAVTVRIAPVVGVA